MQGNSANHFEFFLTKLRKKEPFGLIRPADGEYLVLINKTLTNIDNWTFKSGGRLQNDLYTGVTANIPNLYIGISCPGCDAHIYNYMKNIITNKNNITYANIFCNSNWKRFIEYLKTKPFAYIGSGIHTPPEFTIMNRLTISDKAVNEWDSIRDTFIESVLHFVSELNGELVCFSAGPLSKVLIPMCMEKYPQNTYIDVGSTLDIFMKGVTNREYIYESQKYSRQVCNMEKPHHTFTAQQAPAPAAVSIEKPTIGDLTVILNLFRRPHVIEKQLQAIRNQTVAPKKIIVWVNSYPGIQIPESIRNDTTITIIHSSENFGVWGRFTAGILAPTTYVCVFDDDTIPGRRWFENCFQTMKQREGLLGTVGLRFKPGNRYAHFNRIGWPGPNTNIEEVDIVGHCWFFKREWLSALFSIIPKWPHYFKAGEDIAFSAGLQKIGIPTLVPPHPPGELELYGSMPDDAITYGTEAHSISIAGGHSFDYCLKDAINKGFKTLANRGIFFKVLFYEEQ